MRTIVVAIALLAASWLVFGQTLWHGFLNYDDEVYVYQNPQISAGLTSNSILWAFTHVHARNWHPLTTLSHMLDCTLFDLHAGGHHIANVLLHSLTGALLFLVLKQMTGGFWRSALVAGLFALHPLRVESVAWIAERKDTLSAFFFVLTLGAYARYVSEPKRRGRYLLVLLSFALGLLSKPMLVTTPFVLLLLDYWPLHRAMRGWHSLLLEKLPFFVLALASCIATLIAQGGQLGGLVPLPLGWRIANAIVAPLVYLTQTFWPHDLAPFYPFDLRNLTPVVVIVAATVLICISLVAVRFRKSHSWLFVGWVWYLVMLLPVIGILQIGLQSHADRYTYLPQIGVWIAVVWIIGQLVSRSRVPRAIVAVAASACIIAFASLSWAQTHYWRDNWTLWTHTIAATGENEVAENNLGMLVSAKGDVDEAISHYQRAISIQAERGQVRYSLTTALAENNLASALVRKGEIEDAVLHFQKAIALRPDYGDACYNLGTVLMQQRAFGEAADLFRRTIKLQPNDAAAHARLGDAFHATHDDANALREYEQAVRFAPAAVWAHYSLAWLLATSANANVRDATRAVEIATKSLQLRGGENSEMLRALAAAYAAEGNFREALAAAARAIQLAQAERNPTLFGALQSDIELYREAVPLREIAPP